MMLLRSISVFCFLLLSLFSRGESLERIVVSPDGRGFIKEQSKTPFYPWGVNYGNVGRLIEDFWEEEWQTVADDFRKVRDMGFNVVRVHLQVPKFMDGPAQPNAAALKQLRRLVDLAEETGIYLDLTGLASYRPADRAAWYDALDDAGRWKAQAAFWQAIARECKGRSAVFCYDLMNEPVSPPAKRDKWYSGNLLGDLDFVQLIAQDPAGRTRGEIAIEWIDELTTAIREEDRQTMITVGLLPWGTKWKHLSGIVPKEIAPHVDFISVHIYPNREQPEEAMQALRECDVGKPVVIEETFPLKCSVEELNAFLRSSRGIACGWMAHYDGQTVEEIDALEKSGELTIAKAIWRSGLQSMIDLKPELTGAAE